MSDREADVCSVVHRGLCARVNSLGRRLSYDRRVAATCGAWHIYPSRVRFEIAVGDFDAYQRAADSLNVNQVLARDKGSEHVIDALP